MKYVHVSHVKCYRRKVLVKFTLILHGNFCKTGLIVQHHSINEVIRCIFHVTCLLFIICTSGSVQYRHNRTSIWFIKMRRSLYRLIFLTGNAKLVRRRPHTESVPMRYQRNMSHRINTLRWILHFPGIRSTQNSFVARQIALLLMWCDYGIWIKRLDASAGPGYPKPLDG